MLIPVLARPLACAGRGNLVAPPNSFEIGPLEPEAQELAIQTGQGAPGPCLSLLFQHHGHRRTPYALMCVCLRVCVFLRVSVCDCVRLCVCMHTQAYMSAPVCFSVCTDEFTHDLCIPFHDPWNCRHTPPHPTAGFSLWESRPSIL